MSASDPDFLPEEERRAYQAAWLRELIAHAHAHAPAMRERMPGPDVFLEAVRITRKDELIDLQRAAPPFGGFLGVPPAEVARIFLSPGPLFDPQGTAPDHWRWAPALRAAGFTAAMTVHCAVSYHGTPLGWMFDGALRVLGCTVIPAGVGNTELQVQMVRGAHATGFVGTPSGLRILHDKARELAGAPLTIDRAFVAGEMLPESLREELQALGTTVCQGYGTADLGCLGYECLERDGMHVPADAIVEIVDPQSGAPLPMGETGEVVATVNERTYPIVRFGTGDLALLRDDPCACGRTAPRLARIVGRVGDAAKVRGMFVHPRQVEEIVRRYAPEARAQLVITRSGAHDELEVLVHAPALAAARLEEVAAALHDVIKVRPTLRLVDDLPADAPKVRDLRTWD
ncbi:MAG: phenylacetate--CoA ligase family protein [Candidatus Limnocylindria bacterium]